MICDVIHENLISRKARFLHPFSARIRGVLKPDNKGYSVYLLKSAALECTIASSSVTLPLAFHINIDITILFLRLVLSRR